MKTLSYKCLLFSITILMTAFHPDPVSGQVTAIKDWTSVYNGNSGSTQNIEYTVPAGTNSNRLMVVAIASEITSAVTQSVTLTYGGRPLTRAAGDFAISSAFHTGFYYLNEAGLDAAGANTTLSVTVSGGTVRLTDVWAAVFDHVNQTTPITDAKNYNSRGAFSTSFSFNPPLHVNAFNKAFEVAGIYNSGLNQFRTVTYADQWEMIFESTRSEGEGLSSYYSIKNCLAGRNTPASNITDAAEITLDKSARVSITGISLNYTPPPPPTIQASNVAFSNITSSSFTINWTNGNGTNRIVIVREGSQVNAVPADGTTYTASNLWTGGQEISPGNYVVYNGTADSVNVVNLDGGKTYHVAVFEFSGPHGMEDYLTVPGPARGNVTTLPETAVNGDYRSAVSGNWGTPASWQVYHDGAWTTATSAPSNSDGFITIRSGHTITVAANVTADQVVIDAGGTVHVNSGTTLTMADNTGTGSDPVDCIVNGTLYVAGTLVPNGEFAFNSGSVYHHATDGGAIPAAAWDTESQCRITGITGTAPTGLGQSFGHFTWNCASQSSTLTVSINNNITIKGNITITSTGAGKLALTSNTTQVSMTVAGNYTQTVGTFILNNSASSTVTNNLYVAGNFRFTGGIITETATTGRGAIIFNGNGAMQMFTSGGTFQNTIDFRVESGAFLQLGTGLNPAIITGSKGTFYLSSGATLGITSSNGITRTDNSTNGGNIRVTGTRTYEETANYIYNGAAANQNAGSGLPDIINTLVLANTSGRITLLKAHTITAGFTIIAGSRANLGIYTHTTSNLFLGGQAMTGGSYGGTGSPANFILPAYFDAATGVVNNTVQAGTWLGNTTDWNLASNWAGGVPVASTHARITSAAANQPVITPSVNAVSDVVTIGQGASLTVNGGTQFNSTENNGILTINPGGRATTGSVTNNGTINLESGPSGMFSFMPGSYSGTGTVNTRLFFTGGTAGPGNYRWHYFAVPSRQEKSVVTDISPYDLMWYSEPAAVTNMRQGWQWHDGYDNTTPISELRTSEGYSFYNDDDSYVTFTGNSLLTSLPQKNLSFTTFGWNFLGNSLTCGLNWDAVVFSGNLDPTVHFIKDHREYYYLQGGPGVPAGTTGHIPPLQGFFVQAKAAGASVDFSGAKEHNSIPFYKGSKDKEQNKGVYPMIRLTLDNGIHTDETAIWFDENSTTGRDAKYDAEKVIQKKPAVQIYSSLKGKAYAINGIPVPETSIDIPLTVSTTQGGKYHIRQISIENVEGLSFYLRDIEQKTRINLKENPNYAFTAPEATTSNRFVLTIENTSALKNAESVAVKPFNIYASFGLVNIELLSDQWDGRNGSVKIIDLTGRTLTELRRVEFSRSSLLQLPVGNNKGMFIVEITSSPMKHSGRIIVN